MKFNKELFSKAIRVHRASTGLKMFQAAGKVGLSAASMYRLCNSLDPGMPDIETFHNLVLWMGADHNDFFTEN